MHWVGPSCYNHISFETLQNVNGEPGVEKVISIIVESGLDFFRYVHTQAGSALDSGFTNSRVHGFNPQCRHPGKQLETGSWGRVQEGAAFPPELYLGRSVTK